MNLVKKNGCIGRESNPGLIESRWQPVFGKFLVVNLIECAYD